MVSKLLSFEALTMSYGYLAIKTHQRLPRSVPYHHGIMLIGLEQIKTCCNLKYDRQKNYESMSYVQ